MHVHHESHVTVKYLAVPSSDTKPYPADYEQYEEYGDATFAAAEAEYFGASMRIWALLSNGRMFTIDEANVESR